MAVSSRYTVFESLTRKHWLVCLPGSGIDVETVILAVGELFGLENVKAVSHINKRAVISVSTVNMVPQVVEHWIFFSSRRVCPGLSSRHVGSSGFPL